MARLAVRTLGQERKNYFINSDFRIWQRNNGTAGPFTEDTSYVYKGPDRWRHRFDDLVAASTVRAWARIFDAPVTALSGGIPSAFRSIFRRGNLGIYNAIIGQRIESFLAAELWNQNTTGKFSIGCWVKSDTATSVRMTVSSANAQDNFSSLTIILQQTKTFTANSTWQQIKWEGITPTAAMTNGVEVLFEILTPAAVGADGVDREIRFSMAQINKGDVVEDFTICGKDHEGEIRKCQRYYVNTYGTGGTVGTGGASGGIATSYSYATAVQTASVNWNFPVKMRGTPSCSLYNATTGALNTWNDTGGAAINMQVQNTSDTNVYAINTGSMAAGRYCAGHITAEIEL